EAEGEREHGCEHLSATREMEETRRDLQLDEASRAAVDALRGGRRAATDVRDLARVPVHDVLRVRGERDLDRAAVGLVDREGRRPPRRPLAPVELERMRY